MIRFVEFCAANRLPSVKVAWQKFSTFWPNKAARGITYGQVTYHFPAASFYLMQSHLKAIETAQVRLDEVRFAALADITNRLRERPPRRRVKRETDFQI